MKVMLTILMVAISLSASAQTSEAPASPRTQITLAPAPDNGLTITLGGQKYLLPKEMSSLDKVAKAAGINLALSTSVVPLELQVSSVTHEVVVEATGFEGWGAKVNLGASCQIRPDFNRQVIDLTTAPTAKDAVVLRFHDGGKASMGGSSTLRYDEFKDRSYYVIGKGKIDAENADGQTLQLHPYLPPMTGGPLVDETGKDGVKRPKRLSPAVTVSTDGDLQQKIQLRVGELQLEFKRGEEKTVTLPNGTTAVVKLDPETYTLGWNISKGYVRLGVEEIRGWQAHILSGQNAGFQWDTATLIVDTRNSSAPDSFLPARYLLCTLSRSLSASIGPGGTFQYAPVDEGDKFMASGNGGDVQIYNSRVGNGFDLAAGRVQFHKGAPTSVGADGEKPKINLAWGGGQPLAIGTGVDKISIEPDSKKSLTLVGRGELDFTYTSSGQVGVDVQTGEFILLPEVLKDWTFQVDTGDSVLFTLSGEKGAFTVHAKASNKMPVTGTSPDGFNPVLYPDSTLTFVLAATGFTLGKTDGTMIFYEAAGSTTSPFARGALPQTISPGRTLPAAFGNTTTIVDPTQLRVLQVPVSNFN